MHEKYHIAILGAGISGLTIAWHLKQLLGASMRLTIIDQNKSPGGWIQTTHADGFLFEQGPRSCRTKGAEQTIALIESLGLQDQLIFPHSDAKNRFIYSGHPPQMQKMPQRFHEVLFNPLTRDCFKALFRDLTMPKRQIEDESIYSFFSRRLGKRMTEEVIDPFIAGIYAGDCSRLSIKCCLPLFDQWERESGSLILGAWRSRKKQSPQKQICKSPMFSFRGGMAVLPNALASALKSSLYLGSEAKKIVFNEYDKKGKIELLDGEVIEADHIISTLPVYALKEILPLNPDVEKKLSALTYASITAINAGFENQVLHTHGFGYLVPSKYRLKMLGCVWDSCIFPQQNLENQTRLTLMFGGSRHPEVEKMTDSEISDLAIQVMERDMNIVQKPKTMQVFRAKRAIPQFEVGHSQWKSETKTMLEKMFPYLTVSGTAWSGVSINDCIAYSELIAKQICSNLFQKIEHDQAK